MISSVLPAVFHAPRRSSVMFSPRRIASTSSPGWMELPVSFSLMTVRLRVRADYNRAAERSYFFLNPHEIGYDGTGIET